MTERFRKYNFGITFLNNKEMLAQTQKSKFQLMSHWTAGNFHKKEKIQQRIEQNRARKMISSEGQNNSSIDKVHLINSVYAPIYRKS